MADIRMDDDKFVRLFAKSDHINVERIRELLQSNELIAEVYEEYQLANKAFLHWQQLEGDRSASALQFYDMMKEREQELLSILDHLMLPDGD